MADNVKDAPGYVTGWIGKGQRFLSEVRNEMSRVSWPGRREVWATTIVVILTSIVFGVYLYSIDLGLSALETWTFNRFGAA